MAASSTNDSTRRDAQINVLLTSFLNTRQRFIDLTSHLERDDFNVQTMADASPPKWHLAHTSWFFETFILKPFMPGYRVFHPRFEYLFNSYYQSVGQQYPRSRRGLLIRPTIDEVYRYRRVIDEHITELLASRQVEEVYKRLELGIHHEIQHQELFLTDLKHAYGQNPLFPAFRERKAFSRVKEKPMEFIHFNPGLVEQGYAGAGFCFDNEKPVHRTFIEPFALASRLTTNAEYLAFVESDAYICPEFWLSDGFQFIKDKGIKHPLYWHKIEGQWFEYTLSGLEPLQPDAPVVHVNFYEADAYARWSDRRLATEQEWEHVASAQKVTGNFLQSAVLHPMPIESYTSGGVYQMFGDVWEWTASSYAPYHGFKPEAGAIGEYNGKFMCNQMTLRGGSCATDKTHIRSTYRNFFYPGTQWQFSGIRLASSL